MAQRIWLIRHGKSARPFGVIDHQRPLAARANADAALIRRWLEGAPALYVASTALRAVQTAALLAGERPVAEREELYHADAAAFLAVVEETVAATPSAAFVAHNPTITDLANQLAGRAVVDNVPTLGVVAFERSGEGGNWRHVACVAPKALRFR